MKKTLSSRRSLFNPINPVMTYAYNSFRFINDVRDGSYSVKKRTMFSIIKLLSFCFFSNPRPFAKSIPIFCVFSVPNRAFYPLWIPFSLMEQRHKKRLSYFLVDVLTMLVASVIVAHCGCHSL